MKSCQLIALVLVILGMLGLAWGGFIATREAPQASIDSPARLTEMGRAVDLPVRAAAGAIVIGGLLFAFSPRTRRLR